MNGFKTNKNTSSKIHLDSKIWEEFENYHTVDRESNVMSARRRTSILYINRRKEYK